MNRVRPKESETLKMLNDNPLFHGAYPKSCDTDTLKHDFLVTQLEQGEITLQIFLELDELLDLEAEKAWFPKPPTLAEVLGYDEDEDILQLIR